MNWWQGLRGRVRVKEPLKKHTTLRIGGPVRFFIEPADEDDLKLLISYAKRYRIPLLVIGAGSNILSSDKGLDKIALKLCAPSFRKIIFEGNAAQAASGLALNRLIAQAKEKGLGGAEFLAGIPGTLGGALMMNAGAWGRDIATIVDKVRVMDYSGRIKELGKEKINFTYRSSGLERYIILGASLKFVKKEKNRIKKELDKIRRQRVVTQDSSFPSAGCVFKNPGRESAGRLIDLCGLKGRAAGGAAISSKHANFILNRNNARASDILKLMGLAKREVGKKFGITLEPEIKIWQ